VDPLTQAITLDGRPVRAAPETRHYIALHKPAGYVSTVRDRHAPQKVTDLVSLPGVRLVPVGRLDADSEGLLLLSDDGDFVYRVTHPSQSVGKTYHATVKGTPDPDKLKRLARGVSLDGRPTAPADVRKLGRGPEPGTSVVELILHEGRNRQVRRMLETVGHPVLRLVRTRIGPVPLGDLPPGAWRELTPGEVRLLRGIDGVAPAAAEKEKGNETRRSGRSRPGPGPDHGKSAAPRIQVHQDRVDGRVPPRGQRDAADRRGGQGRRPHPGDHR
jgi:pseudouridine synthase